MYVNVKDKETGFTFPVLLSFFNDNMLSAVLSDGTPRYENMGETSPPQPLPPQPKIQSIAPSKPRKCCGKK